jgi:hypothetical protein
MAPRIMAMAKTGADEKELEKILEREIDDGIEAIRLSLAAKVV